MKKKRNGRGMSKRKKGEKGRRQRKVGGEEGGGMQKTKESERGRRGRKAEDRVKLEGKKGEEGRGQ